MDAIDPRTRAAAEAIAAFPQASVQPGLQPAQG